MRISENKTSITTTGLIGVVLLVAVIWGQINPWWLVLSIFFLIVAIGNESGGSNAIYRKDRR